MSGYLTDKVSKIKDRKLVRHNPPGQKAAFRRLQYFGTRQRPQPAALSGSHPEGPRLCRGMVTSFRQPRVAILIDRPSPKERMRSDRANGASQRLRFAPGPSRAKSRPRPRCGEPSARRGPRRRPAGHAPGPRLLSCLVFEERNSADERRRTWTARARDASRRSRTRSAGRRGLARAGRSREKVIRPPPEPAR
jgi:hypothetical protein